MPKGRPRGGKKHFSNPDELEAQRLADEERRKQGAPAESESDKDDDDDDDDEKSKGVTPVIDTHNPNRVPVKIMKASDIGQESVESSRKIKEQLEADRAKREAERLQLEADLARLALIRRQREEEERQMAEKKKQKEEKIAAAQAAAALRTPSNRSKKKKKS